MNWSDEPTATQRLPWVVRVAQPSRPIQGQVCGPVVGCHTHWDRDRKRTRPCLGTGCPTCEAGKPSRWRGYLPLLGGTLVELTAEAYAPAREQLVFGARVQVKRDTVKATPRVLLLPSTGGLPSKQVTAEEVRAALVRMWGER